MRSYNPKIYLSSQFFSESLKISMAHLNLGVQTDWRSIKNPLSVFLRGAIIDTSKGGEFFMIQDCPMGFRMVSSPGSQEPKTS